MYITPMEYNEIVRRPIIQATDSRIRRACMLLDARIGNYLPDETTGLKLDIDSLPVYQQNAVKEWVAQMVAYLYDNGDSSPASAGLKLGRFSVTASNTGGRLIPDDLLFADAGIVSAGLIKRGVVSSGYRKLGTRSEYEI